MKKFMNIIYRIKINKINNKFKIFYKLILSQFHALIIANAQDQYKIWAILITKQAVEIVNALIKNV